jgi:drug/metabolite transporter (DMT)-like permease
VLHAGWNVLLAGSRDTQSAAAGLLIWGAILLGPPALITGGVSSEAVPFIAASAVLEVLYFVLLARAYRDGELSVVYPVARGVAPALVLVVGAIALNESVSFGAAVGILAVTVGVLLVGLVDLRTPNRDLLFGLAIGAVIASYTLVDSEAMEHADPIAYLALVVAPGAVAYPLVTRTRPDLGPRTALTAAATFGAFLMVLAAFRLAPAAPVAALRETSVVIATLLAAVVLHEAVGVRRMAGALCVAAGVAAIVLA